MIRDSSKCKRFGRGFVLAASLALLASSGAQAATITHHQQLGPWPRFDPALGTLVETRVSAYLWTTIGVTIEASLHGSDAFVSATAGVTHFTLQVWPFGLFQPFSKVNLGCSGFGRCSASGTFTSEGGHSITVTEPDVLHRWFILGADPEGETFSISTDPGVNSFMVPDEIFFTSCSPGAWCSGSGGLGWGGTLTLQYIFTPAEPSPETAPEPTTLSLLALGTAIALLRHRRRKA